MFDGAEPETDVPGAGAEQQCQAADDRLAPVEDSLDLVAGGPLEGTGRTRQRRVVEQVEDCRDQVRSGLAPALVHGEDCDGHDSLYPYRQQYKEYTL